MYKKIPEIYKSWCITTIEIEKYMGEKIMFSNYIKNNLRLKQYYITSFIKSIMQVANI